jgi:hypothetical protein
MKGRVILLNEFNHPHPFFALRMQGFEGPSA